MAATSFLLGLDNADYFISEGVVLISTSATQRSCCVNCPQPRR